MPEACAALPTEAVGISRQRWPALAMGLFAGSLRLTRAKLTQLYRLRLTRSLPQHRERMTVPPHIRTPMRSARRLRRPGLAPTCKAGKAAAAKRQTTWATRVHRLVRHGRGTAHEEEANEQDEKEGPPLRYNPCGASFGRGREHVSMQMCGRAGPHANLYLRSDLFRNLERERRLTDGWWLCRKHVGHSQT